MRLIRESFDADGRALPGAPPIWRISSDDPLAITRFYLDLDGEAIIQTCYYLQDGRWAEYIYSNR